MWDWVSKLWGNDPKVKILIGIFVLLFLFIGYRCASAAELHFEAGATGFNAGDRAPYIGVYYRWGEHQDTPWDYSTSIELESGGQMFGSTSQASNNWAVMTGVRVQKGPVLVGIGFAYLQRVDYYNGSHPNWDLSLGLRPEWARGNALMFRHISNAGTSESNRGRNFYGVDWILRRVP